MSSVPEQPLLTSVSPHTNLEFTLCLTRPLKCVFIWVVTLVNGNKTKQNIVLVIWLNGIVLVQHVQV